MVVVASRENIMVQDMVGWKEVRWPCKDLEEEDGGKGVFLVRQFDRRPACSLPISVSRKTLSMKLYILLL